MYRSRTTSARRASHRHPIQRMTSTVRKHSWRRNTLRNQCQRGTAASTHGQARCTSWKRSYSSGSGQGSALEDQAAILRIHVKHGHVPQQAVGRTCKDAGVRPSIQRRVGEEFRCLDCETRKRTGTRRPATMLRASSFNMVAGSDAKKMPSLSSQQRHCWESMVCWGVKLAVIVKTTTNVNPDAEST